MKIIGKTDKGFIVEATEDELARCAGLRWSGGSFDQACGIADGYGRDKKIRIGCVIDVTAATEYVYKIKEHEKACRDSARILRTLADMVDGALPTTIIDPPAAPAAAT